MQNDRIGIDVLVRDLASQALNMIGQAIHGIGRAVQPVSATGAALNSAVASADRMAGELREVSAEADKQSRVMGALRTAWQSVATGIWMGVGFNASQKIAQGIGFAIDAVFGFNAQLEQTKVAFTQLLGDGERAASFLKELQAFAATTPFEFPDLLSSTQRLMAMGFEADQIIPTMTALGDAVAGVGGSAYDIQLVVTALGQMQAKGKVSGEEMRQLAERNIPVWQILSEKMGKTVPELQKMVEKGIVPADKAVKMLVEGMGERFPGMMQNMSTTFTGAMSTIKDSARIAISTAFEPLFQIVSKVAQLIAAGMSSKEFEAAMQAVAAAVKVAFDVIGAFVQMGLNLLVFLVKLGPITAIVAGLIAGPFVASLILAAYHAGVTFVTKIALFIANMVLAGLAAMKTSIVFIANLIPSLIRMGIATIAAIPGLIAMTANFFAMAVAVLAATWPILAIIAAVVLLYVAFQNNFLGIRDIVTGVFNIIASVIGWFVDTFIKPLMEIVDFMAEAWEQNFLGIRDIVTGVFQVIGSVIGGIIDFFKGVIDFIVGGIKMLFDAAASIPGPWQDAAKDIQTSLGNIQAEMQKTSDISVAAAGKTGPNSAKALLEGEGAVNAAAKDLMDGLPFNAQKASNAAVEAARPTARKIADSLLENRFNVKDAWDAINKVTKDTLGRQKEIAAIEAFLTSSRMKKGLESARPEVRAEYEAWKVAAEERLEALRLKVPDYALKTGQGYSEALADRRQQVFDKTREMVEGHRIHMLSLPITASHRGTETANAYAKNIRDREGNVRTATRDAILDPSVKVFREVKDKAEIWGFNSGTAWGDGIKKAAAEVAEAVRKVMEGIKSILVANSPPGPESPLHEIDKWGERTLLAWGDGARRARAMLAQMTSDALGGVPAALGGSTGLTGASLAGGGGAPVYVEIHNHYGPSSVRRQEDIDDISQRQAESLRLQGFAPSLRFSGTVG